MIYNYTKAVNEDLLVFEIEESSITVALNGITVVGTSVAIEFKLALDSAQESILNNIVASHNENGNFDFEPERVKVIEMPDIPLEVNVTQQTNNNYKVLMENNKVDLNRDYENYNDLYNYSGAGCFHYAAIEFNNENVQIKITIDSVIVMELDCDVLADITHKLGADGQSSSPVAFDKSKDVFTFRPSIPIGFNFNFKIEARANSNSNKRDKISLLITMEQTA